MEKEEVMSKNVEKFLEDYKNTFDTSDKKAAFLLGVLAKFLLDVQLAKRGATPFRTKLHGLKIDEQKLKELLPEIIEKLEEYKVRYTWLEKFVSKYLVDADNNGWNLSKDEVSYYFSLGLTLGELFKEKEEGGK